MRCRLMDSIRAAFISARRADKSMLHRIPAIVGSRSLGIYQLSCQWRLRHCREEAPNPKHQIPNKSQSSNFKRRTLSLRFGLWLLGFEISLGFGFWIVGIFSSMIRVVLPHHLRTLAKVG